MIGMARGAICNLARRGLATTRVVRSDQVHPGYKAIKPIQEKMCIEDGTPVHLKGGAFDSILYAVTMAACTGAVGWEVYFFYTIS